MSGLHEYTKHSVVHKDDLRCARHSEYSGYSGYGGYSAIGLVNPKNPSNIGGVMRAAGCYGTGLVVLGGSRPVRLQGLSTDTQKAWRHIPHICVPSVFDALPYNCVPIAVDLIEGAQSLVSYQHPERAFYIFGPEDGTLSKAVTQHCRDVIYIPTLHCMNLAATVNVVLYDRLAKAKRQS